MTTNIRMLSPQNIAITLIIAIAPIRPAFGWGEPHGAITKAGLDVLPADQKQVLGVELARLASRYCIIPDIVHTDKELAPYAQMDSHPGAVYLVGLHLPAQQPENFEVLQYFIGKSVAALRDGDVTNAARFAGTVCHALEDWSCPAHSVPGDNMFTLFQQFLPPPEGMKGKPLHGPVEAGKLTVVIAGHKPQMLGATVDEAAFRLLHRVNEGTVLARAQVIPIIQGIYSGDSNAVTAAQMKSATFGAKLVADVVHTIIGLGTQKPDTGDQAPPASVDISTFCPLEATNLYFSQALFLSSPYWGHSTSGYILAGGTNAVPLKLRVEENGDVAEKEFASGIGTGSGAHSSMTYLVPANVYKRFTVIAGLHSELGAKGGVEFSVIGNGKPLATATATGDMPAHRFDCDLAGVTNLQLLAMPTKGSDARSNYAIWAEPRVSKDTRSGSAP